MPVSVLRREAVPGEKWTGTDRTLALALTVYESGLCKGCGQPLALAAAHDGQKGHGFARESFQCTSCFELESVSEEVRKNDEPGTKRYTVLED